MQSFSNEFSKYFVLNHDNFDDIIENPVNKQVNTHHAPKKREDKKSMKNHNKYYDDNNYS